MSEHENRLVERLTQRARHELADESGHVNGYTPEEIARWSLRAMRAEDDGLEAMLERASAVRHIDVYREVPGGWRAWAYTPEGEVNRGDATFTGAIRAAVKAALGKGNAE